MYRCSKCGSDFPFESMTKRHGIAGSWCLRCNREATRKWDAKNQDWRRNYATHWRDENREHVRELGRTHYERDHDNIRSKQIGVRLQVRYGITLEDYEHMYEQQGGRCKICDHEGSRDGKRLHVDHDHETGVVRGLLCNSCNLKLGWYEKNRDAVVAYLQ